MIPKLFLRMALRCLDPIYIFIPGMTVWVWATLRQFHSVLHYTVLPSGSPRINWVLTAFTAVALNMTAIVLLSWYDHNLGRRSATLLKRCIAAVGLLICWAVIGWMMTRGLTHIVPPIWDRTVWSIELAFIIGTLFAIGLTMPIKRAPAAPVIPDNISELTDPGDAVKP